MRQIAGALSLLFEGGLVIGNLFFTRRVAWSEIGSLTTGLGASGLQAGDGRVELHVVLKSGSTLQ